MNPVPSGDDIRIGGDDSRPDDAGPDVLADGHGAERDLSAHRMTPHADSIRVRVWISFKRGDSVQCVDCVAGIAVAAAGSRLAFGAAVAAIVRFKNDVAGERERLDISDVAFSRPIFAWGNISMIKYDNGPAVRWFFADRYGHERVNLITIRLIRSDVLIVVKTSNNGGFDRDTAPWIYGAAHFADLERVWLG